MLITRLPKNSLELSTPELSIAGMQRNGLITCLRGSLHFNIEF